MLPIQEDILLLLQESMPPSSAAGRTIIGIDPVSMAAIYAVVISSLALGWQVFTWLRSHGRIRITWKLYNLTKRHESGLVKNLFVCWIYNTGSQPVSIIDYMPENEPEFLWADEKPKYMGMQIIDYQKTLPTPPFYIGPGQCYEWQWTFVSDRRVRCNVVDAKNRFYRTEWVTPYTEDRIFLTKRRRFRRIRRLLHSRSAKGTTSDMIEK